jgi:FkbM family methyltransferase
VNARTLAIPVRLASAQQSCLLTSPLPNSYPLNQIPIPLPVEATTLDDLVTQEGIDRIDLLKMGVEGHELQ